MLENDTRHSFAVDAQGDAAWRWRILDADGALRGSGEEASREAALRCAMFASAAADTLSRVRERSL